MVGMCCGAEEKPQGSVGLEGGWWWSPRGLHLEVVRGQRSGSRAPLLGSSGRCQVVEAQAVKPGVWETGCRWAQGRSCYRELVLLKGREKLSHSVIRKLTFLKGETCLR